MRKVVNATWKRHFYYFWLGLKPMARPRPRFISFHYISLAMAPFQSLAIVLVVLFNVSLLGRFELWTCPAHSNLQVATLSHTAPGQPVATLHLNLWSSEWNVQRFAAKSVKCTLTQVAKPPSYETTKPPDHCWTAKWQLLTAKCRPQNRKSYQSWGSRIRPHRQPTALHRWRVPVFQTVKGSIKGTCSWII